MFNAGATTNNNTTVFLITLRDVLWLRQSLTQALFFLTNDENWVADNQTELNTARDYGNELFESLMEYFPVSRTGEIALFGGDFPTGVIACDGASYPTTTYPDLFAKIGYSFGEGMGGNYLVPDMRGRVPVGTGTGSGLSNRVLGDVFGLESVTLLLAQIPSHTHIMPARSNGTIGASARVLLGAGGTQVDTSPTASAGSGDSHFNIQPSLAVNYGIFT